MGVHSKMGHYLKTFFLIIDIFVMSLLALAGLLFTILHLNTFSTWAALVFGLAAYSLSEYTTHRFFFHMRPPKNPLMLKFIKRMHYDHHAEPKELKLLFLPLWYTLPQIAVVGAIAFSLTQSLFLMIAFITGVMLLLLYYEWAHFVAHQPIKPLTPWGKWMKKTHLWHHYKNENYWYGVTSMTYDKLLGTYKDEKEVSKSPTVRNLEDPSRLKRKNEGH